MDRSDSSRVAARHHRDVRDDRDEVNGDASMIDLNEKSAEDTALDQQALVEKRAKGLSIITACEERHLAALSALATSKDGFIFDEYRRLAWPLLLGDTSDDKSYDTTTTIVAESEKTATGTEKSTTTTSTTLDAVLSHHRDAEQVQKDVDRSFIHYPSSLTSTQLTARRTELSHLILTVLTHHPYLHYFQGYHDIVQVFLLVLGLQDAIPAVERLSVLRIRDFMLPTMTAAITHLNLIPAILWAVDRELYRHLLPTNPFYALSATLTLYAHNIDAYSDIARLFDFLLASDTTAPIYLFVATILIRREELLAIDAIDEPEILQFTIQKLPSPLDLDGLIQRTVELRQKAPPETLHFGAWSKVSCHSVLKTTSSLEELQLGSLGEGAVLFKKHAAEVRRQEMIHAGLKRAKQICLSKRRPAIVVMLTVTVAFAAYVLRGSDVSNMYRSVIGSSLSAWGERIGRLLTLRPP